MDQRDADLHVLISVAGRIAGSFASPSLHRMRNSLTGGGFLSPDQFETAVVNLTGFEMVELDTNGDDGRGILSLTDHGKRWISANLQLVQGDRFQLKPIDPSWRMTPPPADTHSVSNIENEGGNNAQTY